MEEDSTELEPPPCIRVDIEQPPSPGCRPVTEELPGNPRNSQQNFNLMVLVIAFCLSTAVEIAQVSTQTHMPLPTELHLVSLSVVLAFGAILVAKYASSKLPSLSGVLEHVGTFFAATAFMFSVTLSAPPCLKVIYWFIFAVCLLFISYCNCPESFLRRPGVVSTLTCA